MKHRRPVPPTSPGFERWLSGEWSTARLVEYRRRVDPDRADAPAAEPLPAMPAPAAPAREHAAPVPEHVEPVAARPRPRPVPPAGRALRPRPVAEPGPTLTAEECRGLFAAAGILAHGPLRGGTFAYRCAVAHGLADAEGQALPGWQARLTTLRRSRMPAGFAA